MFKVKTDPSDIMKDIFPDSKYVYEIRHNKIVDYIGKTKNPKQRASRHRLNKTGVLKLIYSCFNDIDASELEQYLICKLDPPLNKKGKKSCPITINTLKKSSNKCIKLTNSKTYSLY